MQVVCTAAGKMMMSVHDYDNLSGVDVLRSGAVPCTFPLSTVAAYGNLR